MKKILAILLSAIMVFSLGITAFAADEEADTGLLLPEFPTQTENEIYFASENINVEAGGTYEVPVYIVSNYTLEVEDFSYILVGFNFNLAGEAYEKELIKITGIRPSAEAEALVGYELIGCNMACEGDPTANILGFKINDTSIFNQEKLPLAYVTISVSEAYTGYNEDGEPMDCQLDISDPIWGFYEDSSYTWLASGSPIEIINEETFEMQQFWAGEGVYVVTGHFTIAPPEPTWQDRLIEWAVEQATKILTFFQGINEVLLGLLAGI